MQDEELQVLRTQAEAGGPEAQQAALELYKRFLLGQGVLADAPEAHRWLDLAIELDRKCTWTDENELIRCNPADFAKSTEAERKAQQNALSTARKTLREAESESSVFEAMETLLNLANQGYAPAMTMWCTEILDSEQKHYYGAVKTYLRGAVRQGHPEALAIAGGWLLHGGHGIRQDIKHARIFLERASKQDNTTALALQCRCALRGWGEPKNLQKARTLLERVEMLARLHNDGGRGLFEVFCLKRDMYGIADFTLLRRAAEDGDIRACYSLGNRCNRGEGVPVDEDEAKKWMRKAAFRQYPWAMFLWAEFETLEERKIPWLEKAVKAGIAAAGIRLGILRMHGEGGFLQDWREAERLFRRFAPLCPPLGFRSEIVQHFLAKPLSKRSKRERRFLARARKYLRTKAPARAASVFQTEDPAFAAKCKTLATKQEKAQEKKRRFEFKQTLRELKACLGEAERDWTSGNEEARLRAEETFEAKARWLLSEEGQRFWENAKYEWKTQQHTRIPAMLSRCFWRACQTLLSRRKRLAPDDRNCIEAWVSYAKYPYQHPDSGPAYPKFFLEPASFCRLHGAASGLSKDTMALIHEVCAWWNDKDSLKWLVTNYPLEKWPRWWHTRAVYVERLPEALRIQAEKEKKSHSTISCYGKQLKAEMRRRNAAKVKCSWLKRCLPTCNIVPSSGSGNRPDRVMCEPRCIFTILA